MVTAGPGEGPAEGERAGGASGGFVPGTEVGGYRIVARLGAGAMGAVYRAEDGGGHPVAIKFLHAHLDIDPAGRERLRREALALQRLRHPSVAQVLDVELDATEAFIVTELAEGPTLEEEVDERGALDAADLFELADQLADALEAVHTAGVVHRDLKPSNVLVTQEGPVLIDFGIAQGPGDARATSTGLVMGTPGYLAPELLDGAEPGSDTDWWGWAALLAFAATGRSPFGVRPLETVLARSRAGQVDLAGVGPLTAAALSAALRPDPGLRSGPTEVVRALRRAADEGDDALPLGAVAGAATTLVPAGADVQPTQVVAAGPDQAVTAFVAQDGRTVAVPTGQGAPGTVPATATAAAATATPAAPAPPWDVPAPPGAPGAEGGAGGAGGYPGWQVDGQVDGQVDERSAEEADAAPPGRRGRRARRRQAAQGPELLDELDGLGAPAGVDPATWSGYLRPVHRARTASVLAVGAALVALAATRPGLAALVLAGLVVVCRVVAVSSGALHGRRERRGVGRGDGLRAAVASPWHLVRAVVGAVPSLLVAASGAVLVVVGGWWLVAPGRLVLLPSDDVAARSVGGANEPVVHSLVLALAMLVAVLLAWWGPAARTTREGARTALAHVAPGRVGGAVVVVLALLALVLLVPPLLADPTVAWWPLPGEPAVS